MRPWQIEDHFEENILGENLIFLDLSPHYIGALTNDFALFEELFSDISNRLGNTLKKVRFIGDCGGFLFQNRHFQECMALENWWWEKQINGSVTCPYDGSMLGHHPYKFQYHIIAGSHEEVIDTAGRSIDLLGNRNIQSTINRREED